MRPPPRVLLALMALAAVVFAATAATARASTVALGVASAHFGATRPGELNKLDTAWTYDWSVTAPSSKAGPPWVPMVWGAGSVTPATLAALRGDRRDGRARDLLGFNEPDSNAQSNMTPEQAAALWPKLESTGLELGSPAPAVAQDGWLAHFMTIARRRHLRVDFIALHDYQDVTDPFAVAQLRAQLIAVHRAYHRPIWITELGAIDLTAWGENMEHPLTHAAVESYLRRVVAMTDTLGFVARIGWFTDECVSDASCRDSSLMTAAGGLTAAGRTFRSLAAAASPAG